jgi:hypothetical protein
VPSMQYEALQPVKHACAFSGATGPPVTFCRQISISSRVYGIRFAIALSGFRLCTAFEG